MSGVQVLVGTRKGAFILTSDGARERNETIQVASKMPKARMGCIEVRPIEECNLLFQ